MVAITIVILIQIMINLFMKNIFISTYKYMFSLFAIIYTFMQLFKQVHTYYSFHNDYFLYLNIYLHTIISSMTLHKSHYLFFKNNRSIYIKNKRHCVC
jgi:low temperature requirement protein LtrA